MGFADIQTSTGPDWIPAAPAVKPKNNGIDAAPPSRLTRSPQQLRQLGDVDGYAPSLVAGEQVCRRSTTGLILATNRSLACYTRSPSTGRNH
jgi:hypothetical protein